MKITFEKKKGKKYSGDCVLGDRNYKDEIIIYKDAPDKLKTLIHELIHNFLHTIGRSGYKSRIMEQLNNDEKFVNGLAVRIKEGIILSKE